MRIIKLQADNFMRLVAVNITPDGNLVRVTGKNGSGKTSCLNAIVAALGGSKAVPDKPIREGQGAARVVVETDEYIVTRKFTLGKTTLEIKNKSGSTITSPQKLLDSIVGPISFDPLAFSEMKDKEQREMLLKLLGLSLDEHDAKIEKLRNERAELLASKKRADGDLELLKQTPGLPDEEISVAQLSRQLQEATASNQRAMVLSDNLTGRQQAIAARRDQIKAIEADIAQMETVCRSLETEISSMSIIDTSEIETQIATAEETNRNIRDNRSYRTAAAKTNDLAEAIKAKYNAIQDAENAKAEAIGKAKMPVDGLGVDANGITLDGVPFRQVNHAKRLEVSLAVAMAENPKLRVMLCNGNGLDKETLQALDKLAADKDYQLWVETATDGERGVGIVIEEGMVVE